MYSSYSTFLSHIIIRWWNIGVKWCSLILLESWILDVPLICHHLLVEHGRGLSKAVRWRYRHIGKYPTELWVILSSILRQCIILIWPTVWVVHGLCGWWVCICIRIPVGLRLWLVVPVLRRIWIRISGLKNWLSDRSTILIYDRVVHRVVLSLSCLWKPWRCTEWLEGLVLHWGLALLSSSSSSLVKISPSVRLVTVKLSPVSMGRVIVCYISIAY